ncbi:MAG: M48 family metallopeptidase, partial [Pseudomonadota bacterium]
GSRRGVRPDFDAGRLDVGGPEVGIDRRVAAWLKEEARAWLLARAGVHAAQLGARFERIAIRDTTSRWGSCSASGALSFSWRLILAPDAVSDYVAAHEVAHLREMNHSARFWALVERLRPDWRAQRDWLRAHGADLHRYQVAPPRLIRSDVA